jgi:glycosyltransferase involved in cell wall biosynthesis
LGHRVATTLLSFTGRALRILYHHRTLADGAEGIHIAAMAHAFRALGHDVHMVGAAPSPVAAEGHARDGVGQAAGAWLRAARALIPETAVEAISVGYNAVEWVELRREIDRYCPDLIYKRHARFDVAPLVLAARHRIPLALEVNAVYSAQPYCDFEPLALHGLAKRLERRAFELATLVVTVSTPLARQVSALADARVLILPNGADPQRFDPARADGARIRSKFGLGNRLVIGWTGILRAWHGLDLLLDATAAVPDAVLLVVGDGPERAHVEQCAAELNIRARVVITGRVSHAEMRDYIAAMDIAVVADERTGVASPMKLLEYMATARAVVAPRLESIADIVTDGETGIMFTPGDARDLAHILRSLASDDALRRRLAAGARQQVESARNWRSNALRVLEGVRDDRLQPAATR